MSQGRQQWTKPKDIMRTRRQLKRRSSDVGKGSRADVSKNLLKKWRKAGSGSSAADLLSPSGDLGRKRKNPFGVSSPVARKATDSGERKAAVTADEDAFEDSGDEDLFPDSPEAEDKRKGNRLFSALNSANKKLQEGSGTSKGKQPKAAPKGKVQKAPVTSARVLTPGTGEGQTTGVKEADAGRSSSTEGGGGDGRSSRGGEDTASTQRADRLDTEHSEDSQRDKELPTDWSLKVKLRVVFNTDLPSPPPVVSGQPHVHSSASLTASSPASSGQRQADLTRFMLMEPSPDRKACSMWGFVHNLPLPEASRGGDRDSVLLCLRQCCHYWVFPSMPGFHTFPRIASYVSARQQASSLQLMDKPDLQTSLFNSWKESFGSVYQLLRGGRCVYFYVCCPHFTALFHAPTPQEGDRQGRAAMMRLSACVTPTTRGLRQALLREGVDFTMPYQTAGTSQGTSQGTQRAAGTKTRSRQTKGEGKADDDDDDDDDDEDVDDSEIMATDEGASLWLKDVGLDQKSFPSLQPNKVKIQREGYQRLDGRAESLVKCEGSGSVQALYNFLINTPRIVTTLTGPQAGFPPSILSPAPFLGATLKNNQIQHSLARVGGGGGQSDSRPVLEVSGPLMPHHMMGVTDLLRACPHLSAHLTINTHPPTAPFNLPPDTHPPTAPFNLPPDTHPPTATTPTHVRRASGPALSPRDSPCVGDTSAAGGRELESESLVDRGQRAGDRGQRAWDRQGDSQADVSDRGAVCCGGLQSSIQRRLCSPSSTLTPDTALREVLCHHGTLTWST